MKCECVAVVVTEPLDRLFGQPYFSEWVVGVGRALADHSILPVVLVTENDEDMGHVESFLAEGKADGAILASLKVGNDLPRRLLGHGVPIVIQGTPMDGVDVSYVDTDNRRGGSLAVGHLVAGGRRRIAMITGQSDMPSAVDRLMGFRAGLAAAGIRPDPSFEEAGDYKSDRAYLALERLLLRHPDIDAVVSASDLMAEAAIRALRRAHRSIPDDVAVIGFDDSPIARNTNPPLSSIRQPIEAMGRAAVELLMRRMEQPGRPPEAVILQPELVVRESTVGSAGYE